MMDISDVLQSFDEIMNGRIAHPHWVNFDIRYIEGGSVDEQKEYVEALSDVWSFLLNKMPSGSVSPTEYEGILSDIVRASEVSCSAYPLSITDQYLVRFMPSTKTTWTINFLEERTRSASGDVKTALQGLLSDCIKEAASEGNHPN